VFATPSYSGDSLQLPIGLSACQSYRIAFVTSGTTNATATDIATYNAFVNNAANAPGSLLAPLNTTWRVIGSTAAVSAFANVGGSDPAPIYRMNGTKVASSGAALFNTATTPLAAAVDLDEHGNVVLASGGVHGVWTGTNADGSSSTVFHLGTTFPEVAAGWDTYIGGLWLAGPNLSSGFPNPLYGISVDLTVPAPYLCLNLPVPWSLGATVRLSVLEAGPVMVPPGTPVEASIGFNDVSGNPIGQALTVPLAAGQVQSVDLNMNGPATVLPRISAVPGAYLPPLLVSMETFDNATGFGSVLKTASTGSGAPQFGVQGIAGGQVMRLIATDITRDRCLATLSFNNRNGNPVGSSLNVYLSPGQRETLDLDAGVLGLQSGQRTEVHPVVTTQTPANTPGGVSECSITSDVITKSTGQIATYQHISVVN
jgi:hypothetical protein